MADELDAPFPWFGGKSMIAATVWEQLGEVAHYIEPFFGSGAVLLAAPRPSALETVNDADGLLANFWRAVQRDPEAVAEHADWPVNEADLHARHLWLVGQRERLTEQLMGDAEFCDAKAAGWWAWGASCWIGSGWCRGEGPWTSVDGKFAMFPSGGRGVNRKLPHLSGGKGVNRQLPHLSGAQGVNRQISGAHQGASDDRRSFIASWFRALSRRLRETRVACGDWSRVTGPSILAAAAGVTGVFLDPPYEEKGRAKVYALETGVTSAVGRWCAENGANASLRIVLAGYEGEHAHLEAQGWRVERWKAKGGYGSQGDGAGRENADRERLWISPHCQAPRALTIFDQ